MEAYVDDSRSDPRRSDWFVLAGHIATAEGWAGFSREWARLLDWAPVNPANGVHRFKMSEMGIGEESQERVQAFYRIIENSVTASLSVRLRLGSLENAKNRVMIPGSTMVWDFYEKPFNVCFKVLMDTFHLRKDEFAPEIPIAEKVDFIFDEQHEKAEIFRIWDKHLASRDDAVRQRYGAAPRFENDEQFLPLQAADLWAGAVRRWSEGDGAMDKLVTSNFGRFAAKRDYHFKIDIEISEDWLVRNILQTVRHGQPFSFTYDLDLSVPRPWGSKTFVA